MLAFSADGDRYLIMSGAAVFARAIGMSWAVVTWVGVVLVLTLLVLPPERVTALSAACRQPHPAGRRCALCGMTTAFLRLREGDLAGAERANPWSLPLLSALALNPLFLLTHSFKTRAGRRVLPDSPFGSSD